MRKAVAIVVFLSLLVQCMVHLGIWGYYQVNKAYIARNLCENRNKPGKKCCGKCYLRKQMKNAEENGASKKGHVKNEKSELQECVIPFNNLVIKSLIKDNSTIKLEHVPCTYHFDMLRNVFHPPSFTA